jgi:hypothetical protein
MTHLIGKATAAMAIRRTLDLLFEPGQVIELRVLLSKKQTDAGYFTDREKLITAALAYDGKAPQYVVANPIDPRLLARYNNRMERYAPATTTDDHVIARRWLPIEFDPDRPSGIPASDAEHAEAHHRALDCRAWLAAYGWPEPIYADSGNGAWLLYRLPDLPNTGDLTTNIKRCIVIVSLLYQGQQSQDGIKIKVDATVFNAARLVRLFGTANLKGDGDNASGRHNRASRIVEAPEPMASLTLEAIDRLLAAFPDEEEPARRNGHALNGAVWDMARVERFISDHHIDVAYDDTYHGGHKWVLAECPFNTAHTDKSAVIILRGDGRLGFRCHHNGCNGNDWKALRAMLEPDYAQRGTQIDTSSRRNGNAQPGSEPLEDGAQHPADVVDDAPEPAAPLVALSSFPELPESAHVDEAIGADACPWLDEYIAFSRRWAPDAYDGMHEAIGLWVLATVAARRVCLPWGAGVYTNLYLANCARSSLFTKTTAAEIGVELIRKAGLAPLLTPDEATPESFVRGLTQKIPQGFTEMKDEQREFVRRRLAFAGQRSWAYDEFGMKLSAMMREDGTMAAFRGLLRIFDDNKPSYERETIGRGVDFVQQPYLSLLASLTPADIRPHAKRGSALWGDGFFARFSFVTPPPGLEDTNKRLPEEERIIPDALLRPLRDWHQWLGVPDVSIKERLDAKGKGTGFYDATIEALPEHHYRADRAVFDAFYTYRGALKAITRDLENDDLDPSYSRLPVKAMRVALLFASLERSARIELSHWARAQQIAERWRANLHNLIDQLQVSSEATRESTLEVRVLATLERIGQATLRDFRRYLPGTSTEELERLLTVLARNGIVIVSATRKGTKRYGLPASEPSNRRTVEPSNPLKASTVHGPHHEPSKEFDHLDGSTIDNSTVQSEVSQDLDSSDICDIVTVATLPNEETAEGDRVPNGDYGSDDDRARLARECAGLGQFDTAEQITAEIEDVTYRRDVQREIAKLRPAADTFIDERRFGVEEVLDGPPSYAVASSTIADGIRVESEHTTVEAAQLSLVERVEQARSRRAELCEEYERRIGPLTETLTIEELEAAVSKAGAP